MFFFSISIKNHQYFKLYLFEDQNLQLLNLGLEVLVEFPLKAPNSGQKLLKTNDTLCFLTLPASQKTFCRCFHTKIFN